MRSSNYRHSNQLRHTQADSIRNSRKHIRPAQKAKKATRLGSIVVTTFIVFAAVVIPGITLIQNVEAVTNVKNNVFSIGGSEVFSDVISDSDEKKETSQPQTKEAETSEASEKETVVKETEKSAETSAEEETEVKAPKTKAIVATANADAAYKPKHISLSSYDRAKLERLVMGEAGGLGYKGAALVAQTIRDTMELEDNNSIDYIISSYQYEGSTEKQASDTVKKAVSYIFDKNGYAVQHRLIYFYASDLIDSEWHESQNYIASCGSERFFDRWN